jgi:hypothetical protein
MLARLLILELLHVTSLEKRNYLRYLPKIILGELMKLINPCSVGNNGLESRAGWVIVTLLHPQFR